MLCLVINESSTAVPVPNVAINELVKKWNDWFSARGIPNPNGSPPIIYIDLEEFTGLDCEREYNPRHWEMLNYTTFGNENEKLTPNVSIKFNAYNRSELLNYELFNFSMELF